MTTTILILTLLGSPQLDRYLDAISAVESGHNQSARGSAGERTRYQILPSVWREYCRVPMWRAGPQTRRAVAKEILEDRIADFRRRHRREPSAREVYLLWHRPSRVHAPKPVERERAKRFSNLMEAK